MNATGNDSWIVSNVIIPNIFQGFGIRKKTTLEVGFWGNGDCLDIYEMIFFQVAP
jgi:hypothetical protein